VCACILASSRITRSGSWKTDSSFLRWFCHTLRPSEPCHSPDKAMPSYYTKNGSFASGISKSVVCVLNFISRGVFIGVLGGVTDLIKSVTRQVLAGQPSHVAGRPWSSASTDCQPRIPDYRLLESITTKASCERLQSGAGRPESLAGRSPMGPTG
jgi:hypothetical protein